MGTAESPNLASVVPAVRKQPLAAGAGDVVPAVLAGALHDLAGQLVQSAPHEIPRAAVLDLIADETGDQADHAGRRRPPRTRGQHREQRLDAVEVAADLLEVKHQLDARSVFLEVRADRGCGRAAARDQVTELVHQRGLGMGAYPAAPTDAESIDHVLAGMAEPQEGRGGDGDFRRARADVVVQPQGGHPRRQQQQRLAHRRPGRRPEVLVGMLVVVEQIEQVGHDLRRHALQPAGITERPEEIGDELAQVVVVQPRQEAFDEPPAGIREHAGARRQPRLREEAVAGCLDEHRSQEPPEPPPQGGIVGQHADQHPHPARPRAVSRTPPVDQRQPPLTPGPLGQPGQPLEPCQPRQVVAHLEQQRVQLAQGPGCDTLGRVPPEEGVEVWPLVHSMEGASIAETAAVGSRRPT
jgi:hypothetical protein